ncbi:hypothetical protein QAD02_006692 [Eretmocerus hayati]|uniref:Uncharacterized protein n=1 Tax=Eretmocerus hayati TaxID=131215 RepID=A0ACC2N1K6_9HYME|nr:hypothetical protein QAD02_006692 [Eretmocerus hayati]
MDDEKRLTRGRAKEKNKQQKGESEDKKDIKMKKVTQNTQEENQENEIQIISVVHRKTRNMSTVPATPSQMNIKKEKENVGEEIDKNSPDTIPPCPAAIPIPKAQKEILLIDLEEEEDLKPAVKLEKEIITIKEDQKKVEKAPEM